MRFTRLYSATLLVAAVAVLGSCGESTTPTTAVKDPALDLGTREFTVSPGFVSWPRDLGPIPTDTKTVLVGGVISAASYPIFGAPVYTGDGNDWLEYHFGPSASSFSRDPLGWNVTFKLKPSAQSLPDGPHTATFSVNVPAALNNPQMITVSFGCNALVLDGPRRDSQLASNDPSWDRDESAYNNDPNGGYLYEDWCLRIPAYTEARIDMIGSPCGNPNYTLSDPYLFGFTEPDHDYIEEDDDAGCGYNSIIYIDNSSNVEHVYLVRATAYCSFGDGDEGGSCAEGTYQIFARNTEDTIREKPAGAIERGDKITTRKADRLTR